MIIRQKFIYREDLRSNPNIYYLFGDNLIRKGMGGQAHEMRGEPNAIGIPTKKTPYIYMTDIEYEDNIEAIDEAFDSIPECQIVIIPTDGLGTGLAKLDKTAPKTFLYLQNKIKKLEEKHEHI